MKRLEFWFDFASPYAYLSAIRIDALGAAAGVAVEWRPFLLGPIFKAQGWETSPFRINPNRGRYMIRDVSRIASQRGRVFHMPEVWPAHSVKAARCALVGAEEGWIGRFSTAVFEAGFEQGADISDDAVLLEVCNRLDLDFARVSALSGAQKIKDALRAATDLAMSRGVFGSPTFLTADGEMFWGDDRLEQAIAWSRGL